MTLSACQANLSEQEYRAYLQNPENKCRFVKQEKNIQFDIQYWPAEAEAIRLRNPEAVAQEGIRYFQVKITPFNTPQLLQNPHYWAFGIQHDFWLKTQKEKKPCVFFHSEKGIHVQEGYTCLVGFEVEKSTQKTGTFLFLSAKLGVGPIQFTPDCQPPSFNNDSHIDS